MSPRNRAGALADPSSMSNMNLAYGLALHGFSVTQWIERPPGLREVIGSNHVRDSDFLFVPSS